MEQKIKSVALYVLRSKRSGRLFKWEQYTEDGWGEYHDSVCPTSLQRWPEDMPRFFTEQELSDGPSMLPWISLNGHMKDDVVIVPVTLMFGGE